MPADLIIRMALVLGAAAAAIAGAPGVVSSVLGLTAIGAVVQRVVAVRRRGPLDAVLAGTAGTLIVLMFTGLTLQLTEVPIRTDAWMVALSCGSILTLTLFELKGPPPPVLRGRRPSGLAVWLLASLVVVAGAVAISVTATGRDSQTPLQLSLDASGDSVVVASQRGSGPLELAIRSQDGPVTTHDVPALPPGSSTRIPIVLPATGRVQISLTNPGQAAPLRTLIIDAAGR